MHDLALVNGSLLTLDDAQPTAQAALVRNGRIALIGSNDDVLAAANGVPVFDAGGRTVVPGFIDGHAHLEMTCTALTHALSVTTPPYDTLAAIAGQIAMQAERTEPGQWVIIRGSFNLYIRVEEQRLFTRQELDAISTEHPIGVFSSLHVTMLNTRALLELGLWDGEPPMGTVVHRAEDGTPTGAVTEVWDMLPPWTVQQVTDALRSKAVDLFVRHGITTIHNLPYSAEDIFAVQDLQASGELPLRLRYWVHVPQHMSLDNVIRMGLRPGFGNDMLRFGGVKIFVDGVGHDGYGNRLWDVKWNRDDLIDFVSTAHAWGQQLWMHVCSQPGLRLAADAIEEALRRHPAPHRMRIEHSADYLIDDEDIDRVYALGIGVITTPVFIYHQGDVLALPNSQRFPRKFRLRTLIDRGFGVIGCSDSTGSIPDGIPPLTNIACAVTRRTIGGNVYVPEEAVTPEEGLRMFTTWPAYGGCEEHDKGSITVGKFGDFAVLSDDPRAVEPDALFDLRSEATILGGKVVYGG